MTDYEMDLHPPWILGVIACGLTGLLFENPGWQTLFFVLALLVWLNRSKPHFQ